MTLPDEIDLRGVTAERRRVLANAALTQLRPGGSVLLVSDCRSRELVDELRASWPTELEFFILDERDDACTVEARRSPSNRTVAELLAFEHARIEHLVTEVEWRLNNRRLEEASRKFDQLRTAVQYHILVEEQALLPAYEKARGNGATVNTLLREHDIMRTLLAEARLGLGHPDEEARTTIRALSDLREVFGPHARLEEHDVAPLLDAAEAERFRSQYHDAHLA